MPGDKELLELEARRRIYDHLRRNPGLHLRGLHRELGMPLGTLEYHVHQLEKAGLLVFREESGAKALFVAEILDRRDRDVLAFLRRRIPRRIALHVTARPGITFQALAGELHLPPSTLSIHLAKLRKAGLIQERSEGRQKAYECTDPERVRRLVVVYRRTFVDDVVDRFAAAWLDLPPS